MAGAWMIFVKISVHAPHSAMICTVLTSALKALVMSAFVGSGETPMSGPVFRVIAGVSIVVVICECRRDRAGQQKHCRRYEGSVHGHAASLE
jgi:hypothetical protein